MFSPHWLFRAGIADTRHGDSRTETRTIRRDVGIDDLAAPAPAEHLALTLFPDPSRLPRSAAPCTPLSYTYTLTPARTGHRLDARFHGTTKP